MSKRLTDADYRRSYLTFREGVPFGSGSEPDRKPCGCWALTDHCSACKVEQKMFEAEFRRRREEASAGRMTEAEVRGISPSKRADWIDDIAGRGSSDYRRDGPHAHGNSKGR